MPFPWGRSLLVVALSAAPLLATAPADAAPVTSTGVRCTVVGTARSEVLVGTGHRDVICGRGGNDVIRGRGGNDLIDGGAGNDTILAAGGNDVVVGGSGADRVDAGTGEDRVFGGAGADTLSGGSGADVVSGQDGPDMLGGGAGRDVLVGGDQDDILRGGTEGDDLSGAGGDDTLDGGTGHDELDGGSGANECVVDAEDTVLRCHYDDEAPKVVAVEVQPGTVDVTAVDRQVTVRVHTTDDSAVVDVQGFLTAGDNTTSLDLGHLDRVSGTAADGWWQGVVAVPRWTPAATLRADVWVRDRIGRSVSDDRGRLTVISSDPDTEGPQLTLTTLSPTSIDVRSAARTVTVSVRGVDAKSGIDRVDLCLARPGTPSPYLTVPNYEEVVCQEAITRASGTRNDGTWTTTLTVPQGSVGATYNVTAYTVDRIGNDVRWFGPEAYRAWVDGRWCCSEAHPFADDAGRVDVTGQVADTTPARITEVTASGTTLDTLATSDSVHIRVHAVDAVGPGEGVTTVEAELAADSNLGSAPQFGRAVLRLTSGTTTDGWWEGDVVAPQGTPPGLYHLFVIIGDRAHGAIYTDPGHPDANGVTYQPFAGMPTFTVVAAG